MYASTWESGTKFRGFEKKYPDRESNTILEVDILYVNRDKRIE